MKKAVVLLLVAAVIVGGIVLLRKKGGEGTEKKSTPKQEDLTIKGSDTEVQLVSNLAEAFLENNKNANLSVTGGGSGVGIAALINGEIDLANSSRKMSEQELATAKSKNLDVQVFILAGDGICIITHPSNPLTKLSMEDISKIYKGEVTNWKTLGGQDAEIVLYGRQSTSGTYVFFRDFAVKADYSPKMRNMEGSQAIIDSVITDKNGIGYVGVGYAVGEDGQARTDIKVIPVSQEKETTAFSPLDREAVKAGNYPIFRRIYQYLPVLPQKDSAAHRFLIFEMSDEGQNIIEKTGFYKLGQQDIKANQSLLEKIQ